MNSAFLLSFTSMLCLLPASTATSDQLEKRFTLEGIEIKHLSDRIIQDSELGRIFTARDCAISGRIFEFRTEKCRSEVPAICSVLSDKVSKYEIVFMPTENIDEFKVRFSAISSDGHSKSHEIPSSGQKLLAGEPYLLTYAAAPTAELTGRVSVGRMEIVDNKDGLVKICAEADYFTWPKNVPVDEF